MNPDPDLKFKKYRSSFNESEILLSGFESRHFGYPSF